MRDFQARPRARQNGLLVRELADGELVVYDRDDHQAHCLNRSAVLVWRLCDGETTVPEIADQLTNEFEQDFSEDLVRSAILALTKEGLMEETPSNRCTEDLPSRREFVARMGKGAFIAASIPLITSILIPAPAAAASCLTTGMSCLSGAQCCSGLCIGGGCA